VPRYGSAVDDVEGIPGAGTGPLALRLASVLVGGQAVGLLLIPVFYVVELTVADTADVTGAALTAALAAIAGAALFAVARGLARAQSWARSPALVTQLIIIPVTSYPLQSGHVGIGLALLGWAGLVVVLLFSPSVNQALRGQAGRVLPPAPGDGPEISPEAH